MLAWGFLRRPWVQRGIVSAALLAAVALWVEPAAILAEVTRLAPEWVLAALGISVLQVMLSAWRWKLTAGLVDVPLRFRYALREYYLALLVNQLLPGGVLGDAGRAHRHARQAASKGSAWRAVVIERASGQVAVALLTLVALFTSPLWHAALGSSLLLTLAASLVAVLLALVALGEWMRRGHGLTLPTWCNALGRDIRRGLLQRGVWPLQLASSLAIVLSYGLVMVCAARAIGSEMPALEVLALSPVLLLAMLVPLSIAGWGLREGAAAGIWVLVGLPAAQGVAISLAYGVLVLVSSLPGVWVALAKRAHATPSASFSGPTSSEPTSAGGLESAKLHVEQRVVSTPERAHRGAQRALKRLDGRHLQTGPAGTYQQRGHHQVQAINALSLNELGNGNSATFYQHAFKPASGQQFHHIRWGKLSAGVQGQHAVLRMACRRRSIWPGDMQSIDLAAGEQRHIAGHAPTGVKYHSSWVAATHVANGELGIVGSGGARAYHHRIRQGTQPVQVHQALTAIDVVRVAAFRGNSPIQALAQLGDHPVVMQSQRGKAIQQRLCLGRDGVRRMPLAVAGQRDIDSARRAFALACQPRPRRLKLNDMGLLCTTGVGHDASTLKTTSDHAGPCCPTQATFALLIRQPGGLHVSN
ncbi:hypothetical protein GCM10011382_05020 [Vreelandella lutescens]|uniref:Flippase-like domain-containing protein n=1 Tax=Vreelandella lutescens TaxID=1602943 RepID=A0ABQ1NIF2_9GAMM|nr:hypothetical protein GCM10011382_05020 [Halomonas lutescens]